MFRFFLEIDYILEYVISFSEFRILTRNNDFFEKSDICKQPFINLKILGFFFSEEKRWFIQCNIFILTSELQYVKSWVYALS